MKSASAPKPHQPRHSFLARRFPSRALGRAGTLLGVILLLLAVASCGLFRREPARPTAAPRVEAVTPTAEATPTIGATETALPRPTLALQTPTTVSGQAVPSSGIALGIYLPMQGTSGNNINKYVQEVGKQPAFAWVPATWQAPDGSFRQFDPQVLDQFRTRGIMPGLTWEPSKGPVEGFSVHSEGINQTEFSWKQIISGRYDDYLTQFAQAAAAYRFPFLLRILHEMNGTWYPWAFDVNGNSNPKDYVAAWAHIVDIFRKENATNVQFVWCPTVMDAQNVQKFGATLRQAYPGDNYVDWIGLDGYSNPTNGWKSLQDEFQPGYDLLTSFSTRPMILFEVGAMENPSDPNFKANWINQGFLTTIPDQLPEVKIAVWFDSKDGSGRDFALESSPAALAAWKEVVASPLYQGSLLK